MNLNKELKILSLVLLTALLAAVFFGCGKADDAYTEMNIEYKTGNDGSSYTIYNGDSQEFFDVKEGCENIVEVTVHKESGHISIVIHEENNRENVVYEGSDFPADYFTVTVKEAGRYRIFVHAEDFIGTYKFQYDMNQ